MFSKSRPTPDRASLPPARPTGSGTGAGTFSVLAADVVVTGNIEAKVDLHLDGRIEGDVTCATLAQGQGSVIRGRVTAEAARLAGTVEGAIDAKELVIEASARILGDVSYERLTIEQGATVEGRFAQRAPAPKVELVASN